MQGEFKLDPVPAYSMRNTPESEGKQAPGEEALQRQSSFSVSGLCPRPGFAQQKQVGQQCAQMDGCIEVIDHLGADALLLQHQ